MLNLDQARLPGQQAYAGGFRAGMYNDGQGGIIPPAKVQPQRNTANFNMYNAGNFQQFPQPSLGYGFNNQMMMPFANPYAMAYPNTMPMGYTMPNMNLNMQANAMKGLGIGGMGMMSAEPLNQGQIDMVERWRQSVMQ